ncbi:MAG TPA: hypothetical protein VKE41_19535 [Roseiflexaceae bacterium]|nr:hypothetical protein [Roseiflexaceae bacterium]
MAISTDVHQLLRAYDGLTNFAGGPDLPWVLETYAQLDDSTVLNMIQAFCYAWAAGQRAAGCYKGSVECLAQAIFAALPTWDDALPREAKATWLRHLGIVAILPEPEPRQAACTCSPSASWSDLDRTDHSAIEDMANYFQIGIAETTLLYHLGRALTRATPMQRVYIECH